MGRKKTIIFLHPDLGIGGAERLVVDAAVSLQERGHKVVIFTSHCDPAHCFDEARDDTLDIRVVGNTIFPSSILGRFTILCAIARQLHLILSIWATKELQNLHPTDFFVDQLSAGLPLLRLVANTFATIPSKNNNTTIPTRPSIFFYCHFPDLLLARGRESLLKRIYRLPFDMLEEWSMGFADGIAVNSSFTRSIVAQTWPRLAEKKKLDVVYPCVNTATTTTTDATDKPENQEPNICLWKDKTVFLSINRFERKKDIGLAIRAFRRLLTQTEGRSGEAIRRASPRLVLAGGYDVRVAENVEYHQELERLAEGGSGGRGGGGGGEGYKGNMEQELQLSHATARTLPAALEVPDDIQVVFLPSIPNGVKDALLSSASLLLYTPQNEHFGIVPLEAMLKRVPILAVDSGGPKETVSEEVGWLRNPDDREWAEVLEQVILLEATQEGKTRLKGMGLEGEKRVKNLFGREKMGESIDVVYEELGRQVQTGGLKGLVFGLLGIIVVVLAIAVGLGMKMMTRAGATCRHDEVDSLDHTGQLMGGAEKCGM